MRPHPAREDHSTYNSLRTTLRGRVHRMFYPKFHSPGFGTWDQDANSTLMRALTLEYVLKNEPDAYRRGRDDI